MQDQAFTAPMKMVERAAWCPYVSLIRKFLGNTKAGNYRNLVDVTLQNFQALGARISINFHYLFSHLDYIPENLGDVSEEQGGGSIKTLGRWKKGTKVVGTLTRWQIIAGH